MAKRKPEGSHKFLHMIVCDRCGHKESWGDRWTAMAAHVKQHLSERPPGPEPGGRKVPSRSIGSGSAPVTIVHTALLSKRKSE